MKDYQYYGLFLDIDTKNMLMDTLFALGVVTPFKGKQSKNNVHFNGFSGNDLY